MFEVKAKKKLSQNFLVDKKTQTQIVQSWLDLSQKHPDLKSFLEIGPGTGSLTEVLLQKTDKEVLAIEIDTDLIPLLKEKLENYPNLKLEENDALKLDWNQYQSFVLVANMPYQVGSRILINFSIFKPKLPFSLIFQKEVAQKALFKDSMTLFGAWLNIFYDCEILFDISKDKFYPQPNVVSSLLQGIPRQNLVTEALTDLQKRRQAFLVLKNLFQNPRKSLANNLKNLGWEKVKIQAFLEQNNLVNNFRWTSSDYQEIFLKVLDFC
jgi:16S rRNA (adenine1518-N6/adenine1519-N6)-dimethyltransferase